MSGIENFPISHLRIEQREFSYIDLPALFGDTLHQFPMVLRILLENVIRNTQGDERKQGVQALSDWTINGTNNTEIPFLPNRLLMHDTTSTPALVDIAGMRDELAERGIAPHRLTPTLPVEISVDHSLAVEAFARHTAPAENMQWEIKRNKERYRFLRWASRAIKGVHVNPPGTGIMHTINLEQLATVVTIQERDGQAWLTPDVMLGTDSHTPMINGIGVLGWGVGGLEAESVMFGIPTTLRIPEVIGVKLEGALHAGALATDLALTVTERLRTLGVAGGFVEFYGPGVSTLSAGERAVVANMAPEYGATTGYFPIDSNTIEFLRHTGRSQQLLSRVELYAQRAGLWFAPEATPRYSRSITIDLRTIGMRVAGPKRPQDLLDYSKTADTLRNLGFVPSVNDPAMPRHPVVIAAITSCTNTTDPKLLIAAGLLARKARKLGLKVPSWVKTSTAPGSPAAAQYLSRIGLTDDLSALGFDIVGFGCTTCIGNSGHLLQPVQDAMKKGSIYPVAVLSGNRNFPGRIHPDLDLGFLMSPPLVIAFALAGDAERDLSSEPLQYDSAGRPVYLQDIWPSREDVDALFSQALVPEDFSKAFAIASHNTLWNQVEAPESDCFPWDADSTILRRPPFTASDQQNLLGTYSAYPLLILGDDITTDHISPASAIPSDSLVADFLVERGENRHDLNVFASRRGNWEVMLRASFYNKSVLNLIQPGLPIAHTLHVPSGDVAPIWDVANRYQQNKDSVVLIAGERYGTGSSRDWAAKAQKLLGIRAVLALSFERIHRSNLIGMGILPLILPANASAEFLKLRPGDKIRVAAPCSRIEPRASIPVTIERVSGIQEQLHTIAAIETQLETNLLKIGGVIPHILQTIMADAPSDTRTEPALHPTDQPPSTRRNTP